MPHFRDVLIGQVFTVPKYIDPDQQFKTRRGAYRNSTPIIHGVIIATQSRFN
jgi:hypothetical protein